MMELGATICVPRTPACGSCPVAKFCGARAAGTERGIAGQTEKAGEARDLPLDLVILERECHGILLIKRASTERRMADFWELPEKHLFPHTAGKVHKTRRIQRSDSR